MSINFTRQKASLCFALIIICLVCSPIIAMAEISEKDITPYEIRIGNIQDAPFGEIISVPVIKTAGSEPMFGFDFLISYNITALTFIGCNSGEIYDIPGDYEWEYFTYRFDALSGDTGYSRVVGIADQNDGPHVPLEMNIPDGTTLFTLDYLTSDEPANQFTFTPIEFIWLDCGDNAIAYGDSVIMVVSNDVYDSDGLDITDTLAGFPTYCGIPQTCLDVIEPTPPERLIDFYNGGVEFGEFYMDCRLEVFVNDTDVYGGEQSVISVYMNNYIDTIAGFEMFISLGNPEICEFIPDEDTVYVVIDTTGTLCSGWEHIAARSYGETNIKIVGLANTIVGPYTEGISPQSDGLPLINIPVNLLDPQFLNSVEIYIQHDNLENFSFSDQNGNTIGLITEMVPDTTWLSCIEWDGEVCLEWEQVFEGPADSFYVDTILSAHLDTNAVCITHGSLTLLDGILCGDVNNDGNINILDITSTIVCIYTAVDPPCDLSMMDVDCNELINILDLVYLINYLYKGGPAPNCIYCTN